MRTNWVVVVGVLGAIAWHGCGGAELTSGSADTGACVVGSVPERSLEHWTHLRQSSPDESVRALASGELGLALARLRRYEQAEPPLQAAANYFADRPEAARYTVEMGNLALIRHRPDDALRHFQRARDLAASDGAVSFAAELGLARLVPERERLARLQRLSERLSSEQTTAIRQHLALGIQAQRLGSAGVALAWRHLDSASRLAARLAQPRLQAEALDALAQLYETQFRPEDALRLTLSGLTLARAMPPGDATDLLIALEWRQARLYRLAGKRMAARAAFQRAVEQVEAARLDLPIFDEEGRSVHEMLLAPLYLGYVDLLLTVTPYPSQADLQRVVETVESVRQTELQDFLGDRCAVEAVRGSGGTTLREGNAVLYPLILPDRLELLLVSHAGIVRRSVAIPAESVHGAAQALADALRSGTDTFLEPSKKLHAWLLGPFADDLKRQSIRNLIVVPEGPLRLVPMAALHDGRHFAIEDRALTMVTGLSMTNLATGASGQSRTLVAGVSVPGQVVEKMEAASYNKIVQAGNAPQRGVARGVQTRAWRGVNAAEADGDRHRAVEAMRASLSLPGVRDEVESLRRILPGTVLLDDQFTVGRFQDESGRGDYRIVHIASHGVFGGSADTSFIMAYDDLLSINGLEALLMSDRLRARPIELLGLSACETAEGNDRAPLGFAGVAIKARARAVLGTLWPVEDNAAKTAMQRFYGAVAEGRGKGAALREAQLALLANPETAHPFFWAPFVLIGNWQ